MTRQQAVRTGSPYRAAPAAPAEPWRLRWYHRWWPGRYEFMTWFTLMYIGLSAMIVGLYALYSKP